MGKISTPWKPVDQSSTTHPNTRVIDASKAGQVGSVRAAPQPVAEPQKQPGSVDYAQRIALTPEQKAGGKAQPMPEGNATSLQSPISSPVLTVSNRAVPEPAK